MSKEFLNQEYMTARAGKKIEEGTLKSRILSRVITCFFIFSIFLSAGLVSFSIIFFFSPVIGTSMMQTLNANCNEHEFISDSVVVNRYKTSQKGDIIVVRYYWPVTHTDWQKAAYQDANGRRYDYFIKRLIAIEGDWVYFELTGTEGNYWYNLYVNGEQIDESEYLDPIWGQMITFNYMHCYLDNHTRSQCPFGSDNHSGDCPYQKDIKYNEEREQYEILVPEGHIFYMGDNRGGDGSDPTCKSYDCTKFGPQPIR